MNVPAILNKAPNYLKTRHKNPLPKIFILVVRCYRILKSGLYCAVRHRIISIYTYTETYLPVNSGHFTHV